MYNLRSDSQGNSAVAALLLISVVAIAVIVVLARGPAGSLTVGLLFLVLVGLSLGASYIFRAFYKAGRVLSYVLGAIGAVFILLGVLGR